jgi:hypothetical protein
MRPEPNNSALIDWVCPINWLHPLAANLLGGWIAIPGITGGSSWPDICNINSGVLTGMTVVDAWAGNKESGLGWGGLTFDGTSGRNVRLTNPWADDPQQYSVAAFVTPTSVTGVGAVTGYRGGSNPTISFQLDRNTTSYRFICGGASGVSTATVSSSANIGRPVVLVGSRNGNASTTLYVFEKDFAYTPNTSTSAIGAVSSQTGFRIGSLVEASVWIGDIKSVLLWKNRALTADDAGNIAQEMWSTYPGLLNRVRRRTFSVAQGSAVSGYGSVTAIGRLTGAGLSTRRGSGTIQAIGRLTGAGYRASRGISSVVAEGDLIGVGRRASRGQGSVAAVAELEGVGYRTSRGFGDVAAIARLVGHGYRASRGFGEIEAIGRLIGVGPTSTAPEFLWTCQRRSDLSTTVRRSDLVGAQRRSDLSTTPE